jgi:beta-xylosidase
LFWDNGKTILTTTSGAGFVVPDSGYFAIWKTEIDIKTGDSLVDSEVFHISSLPLDTPRLAEGSHLFKKDGWYYLLTAEAGTEVQHRSMIKRARSVDGKWEQNPNNPILFNGRDRSLPILSTGHGDFVQTPKGDWYMVFLGTRQQNPRNATGYNQLGRETFFAPVEWKDGWPLVNGGKPISLDMPGLYNLDRPKKWRDDFSGGKLADKAYYFARTPYKAFHNLEARPGFLRLHGNPYTLSDRETPAALFRKQVDLETVWMTELDFHPKTIYHEAGASVYLSVWFHNEIAVTVHPNNTAQRVVTVKTRTGPEAEANQSFHNISSNGLVSLAIKAERDQYSFGYALDGGEVKYVSSISNRWLQAWPAGQQSFTGAFFGIYATGTGLPILVPAVRALSSCHVWLYIHMSCRTSSTCRRSSSLTPSDAHRTIYDWPNVMRCNVGYKRLP